MRNEWTGSGVRDGDREEEGIKQGPPDRQTFSNLFPSFYHKTGLIIPITAPFSHTLSALTDLTTQKRPQRQQHPARRINPVRAVLHRDPKPDNVFLDATGNIKLGGFGLSQEVGTEELAETCAGTLDYVSPEVVEGKSYDSKSDIWSLGCIAYELCALNPTTDPRREGCGSTAKFSCTSSTLM
ncbi:unnamed protein product [Tilletia laevis]|uniref:non-specific serine/threonine protein kinase n=1 Tax=Tilletia laevis TaxID=157183 RepID=A0A9N8Q745_9BASI|nr:unnamed protein product [Tilletia laevis]